MKSAALFVFMIFAVGAGTFVGSVAGAALDREGNIDLFGGALFGGIIMTCGAAVLAERFRLITREQVFGTAVGAGVGFLITAAVAMNRSSPPPGAIAAVLLIGLGGLIGRRFYRSRTSV